LFGNVTRVIQVIQAYLYVLDVIWQLTRQNTEFPTTIRSESNESTRYNATKIFFCGLQHYADGDKKPLHMYM
jgi:hypothetical protein